MRLALIAVACAALLACGEKTDTAGPERRSAAGEVLGGEVTDDMLPLDTVRSTSPADARASGDGSPGAIPAASPGATASPAARATPEPGLDIMDTPAPAPAATE